MATEFERLKRRAEEEKAKKTQGEAKIESLREESIRIHAELTQEVGIDLPPINTKVEAVDMVRELAANVAAIENELKNKIESDIAKIKEVFDKEGVTY